MPVTVVALSVGLLAGYAMTKLKNFKRKQIIFNMLLFEMFFPVIMLLVPKYVILKGLANSYAGMIVPTMISTWAIFMYINFFKTLPNEVFEAARMDGAMNSPSASMHTLSSENGWTRICHYGCNSWTPNVSLYKVYIKCRLWLEMYETHLRTGKPIDYYLNHQS